MNILFIEDERELLETGVAQLEALGHTVYPVADIGEARQVMADPAMPVKLVIADQRLPDGQGIHFITEMKPQFPDCLYVIVSGCLTDQNIVELKEQEIPYYHKPLLYGKLVDKLRRELLSRVPVREVVAEEATSGPEEQAPKKKKWFGLFG